MEDIREHILNLETQLLTTEVRKSAEKIREIVSEDFIEFCSSGYIYKYNKDDIFAENNDLQERKWEIKYFDIKELSKECILATYRVIKHDELQVEKKYSLRSSIWKCLDEEWKLIFHQGTSTSTF